MRLTRSMETGWKRGEGAAMTTAELADRIDVAEYRAAELLAELKAAGHTQRDPGGAWRLSPATELAWGAALRRIDLPDDRGRPPTPDHPRTRGGITPVPHPPKLPADALLGPPGA